MSKRSQKKQPPTETPQTGPWIQMRTGLIIIAVTSVAMFVLTTVQVWGSMPPLEAIFWGLVYAALIWVAFLGMLFFNRLIGRK